MNWSWKAGALIQISDEQISGICVFEKGERCGGGVGQCPRVTITRSAHISHVASL